MAKYTGCVAAHGPTLASALSEKYGSKAVSLSWDDSGRWTVEVERGVWVEAGRSASGERESLAESSARVRADADLLSQ